MQEPAVTLFVSVETTLLFSSFYRLFETVTLTIWRTQLGGVNQSLNPAKLCILGEGKTMVVGRDVTHPSPGSADSAPSVAAIVASVDKMLGQWPANIR